jgi:hypothetical protein
LPLLYVQSGKKYALLNDNAMQRAFFPLKGPLHFLLSPGPVQENKDIADDDEQEDWVHDREGNIAGNPERVLADLGMGACIIYYVMVALYLNFATFT